MASHQMSYLDLRQFPVDSLRNIVNFAQIRWLSTERVIVITAPKHHLPAGKHFVPQSTDIPSSSADEARYDEPSLFPLSVDFGERFACRPRARRQIPRSDAVSLMDLVRRHKGFHFPFRRLHALSVIGRCRTYSCLPFAKHRRHHHTEQAEFGV